MIRAIFVTIWIGCSVVGLAIWAARIHPSRSSLVALEPMRRNHILRAEDFRNPNPSLVGRYLRVTVAGGDTVTEGDVSFAPLLSPDSQPWFALPIGAKSVRDNEIEPNTVGVLCDGSEKLTDAESVVVVCPPAGSSDICTALVRVKPDMAVPIAARLASRSTLASLSFRAKCN